jgi:hypothetical protein
VSLIGAGSVIGRSPVAAAMHRVLEAAPRHVDHQAVRSVAHQDGSRTGSTCSNASSILCTGIATRVDPAHDVAAGIVIQIAAGAD